MAGRPRSRDLDDAIVDAVRELLSERGYQATTVDAVAGRAGVPKSSLYRRWPSKAQLVFHAAVHRADPELPDTGSLPGDLHALAVRVVASLSRPEAVHALPGLLAELLAVEATAASFRAEYLAAERALVHAVLDRAVGRAELPRGAACPRAVTALHAHLLGTAFAWTVILAEPVPRDLPRRLAESALTVIRPRGTPCSTT